MAATAERVAAMTVRLRARAELHNAYVASLRARNKWLLGAALMVPLDAVEAVPVFLIIGAASTARHLDTIDAGAEPLFNTRNLINCYVTAPPVALIEEKVERISLDTLAEQVLVDEMIYNPENHYYLWLPRRNANRDLL